VTVIPRRRHRPLDRGAAVLLSGLLALAGALLGTTATLAISEPRSDAGLDAPIHAFDWPASAPDDPYFANQLDLTATAVPAGWLRTTGVPTVVVAVLDTGIDATHPEFSGRLVPGYNALTATADAVGDFGPTNDDEKHGTHVSGTLAAAANNAQGIAGIAPNVSIMPVKILDNTGSGDFRAMVDGMNWAISHGARIITMSLGGSLDATEVANLQPVFDAAYAQGTVVVAASGNDGTLPDGASASQYPCNFVHVICVGSTTRDGTAVSTFSTRTPALALVAPGENIVSALPGNAYGSGTGTSMATPHVTGAVALLRSIDPAISVDQVLADLTQTAKPIGACGRNPDSGYGLLQVGPALDMAAGGTPTPCSSPTPTPDPSASPTPSPTPDQSASPTPTPTPSPAATPFVMAATPGNGTRNVARSVRPRLTFSVPMRGLSTRTVTLLDLSRGRRMTIRISVSTSGRLVTIIPALRLASNHSYRIWVKGIASASAEIPLRAVAVTFRTGYR